MAWMYSSAAAGGALVSYLTRRDNDKSTTPAPDYAAANLAGIEADLATLPMRLQVNQAAATGGVYTDPKTGNVFDFRGRFDPVRFFKQNPQAYKEWTEERAKGELQGWNEEDFAKAYFDERGGDVNDYFTGSPAYRIQTDINSATQLAKAGADISDQSARNQLQTQLDLLPKFNQLNLDQQIAAANQSIDLMPKFGDAQRVQDTATFNNNLALGQNATRSNTALQAEILPGINDLSLNLQQNAFDRSQAASNTAFKGNLAQATAAAANATQQQQQNLPALNDLQLRLQQDAFAQNVAQTNQAGANAINFQQQNLPALNDLQLRLQTDTYKGADAAARSTNPNGYAVRDQLGRNIYEGLASGDSLTPAQMRKVQQRIRGAQASRGNILGNGAAFEEAIAESDYAQQIGQARRNDALGFINSRDLAPNFSSVGVLNPTQVATPNSTALGVQNPSQLVAPNLQPANFNATTAINPLMPNFAPSGMPNLGATTAGMPNLSPTPINLSNPLGMLNPNAGSSSASYGLNAWNSQQNRVANVPNPWMQGLGMAFKTYGTFGGG